MATEVSVLAQVVKAGDVVDVDDALRGGEAQLEHGDQALPAGEDLGLPVAAIQDGDGLSHRSGGVVRES